MELSAPLGDFFTSGEIAHTMFDVTSPFLGFDMFFHDYLTDTWIVQAIETKGLGSSCKRMCRSRRRSRLHS